jgi:hypothetical protein
MSGLRLEVLDDLAAHLLVAPLVASLGMGLAAAPWLQRSLPCLQLMGVGSRRRARS